MKKFFFGTLLLLFFQFLLFAQSTRVLFIGNSYTQVNDLPQLFLSIASSTGDHVFVDANMPGGATFQNHCTNTSATKIQEGGWDFVVLQEQSQLPAFPISQVQTDCFPYAAQLNQMIETYNPCAETVFYMTWGRKYGDQANAASYPPLGTYEGMDSLLYERYMQMTQDNNAIVAPVGRVWRYLRTNNPTIELYSSDNSHPSLEGSYAAACAIYTTILRKDPTLITNYCGLNQNIAQIIQNATKTVIFDNQSTWFIGERDLEADFTFSNIDGFHNQTINTNLTTQYHWDFGNEDSSSEENPNYIYSTNGEYRVTLKAIDSCNQESIIIKNINVVLTSIDDFSNRKIKMFPNPTQNVVHLEFENLQDQMVSIDIVDRIGKRINRLQTNGNSFTIDILSLKAGLYFIRLEQGMRVDMLKLIVQ